MHTFTAYAYELPKRLKKMRYYFFLVSSMANTKDGICSIKNTQSVTQIYSQMLEGPLYSKNLILHWVNKFNKFSLFSLKNLERLIIFITLAFLHFGNLSFIFLGPNRFLVGMINDVCG